MIGLSNRVHTFARPGSREPLTEFFTAILGCAVQAIPAGPGPAAPILGVTFPAGGSLSVEFTADALDDEQALRGAWLEVQTGDAPALKQKILEAGLPRVAGLAPGYFYFQAPGGQVWRFASRDEQGS